MPGHLSDRLRQILDDEEQAEKFHRHMLRPKRGEKPPVFKAQDEEGNWQEFIVKKLELHLPEKSV